MAAIVKNVNLQWPAAVEGFLSASTSVSSGVSTAVGGTGAEEGEGASAAAVLVEFSAPCLRSCALTLCCAASLVTPAPNLMSNPCSNP